MGKGKTTGHAFLLTASALGRRTSKQPGCYAPSSCDGSRRCESHQPRLRTLSSYQSSSRNPHHSSQNHPLEKLLVHIRFW